jgi:DNA-binding transcriptional MerR regulator
VSTPALRIGEVARQTGLTPEVLRIWERRYGVLQPGRSSGGFRLYSEDDIARVERMRELLDRGVSASEAARVVAAAASRTAAGPVDLTAVRHELLSAILTFDEQAVHAMLDGLLDERGVESVLRDVLLPVLAEIGSGWQRGDVSVAQEHFGSQLLRGRLFALARGWSRGIGPRALLACPPGELHDLGLIAFGVALNRLGWRIAFLGPDTPLETLASAAQAVSPSAIVLARAWRDHELEVAPLRELGTRFPIALGGAGVDAQTAERAGARYLDADPVAAAELLAHSA